MKLGLVRCKEGANAPHLLRNPAAPLWLAVPRCCACAAMLTLLVGGCAHWNDTSVVEDRQSTPSGLPEAQLPDEATLLNIAFISITPKSDSPTAASAPWDSMDETIVPMNTRETLAANGLRVGRVMMVSPDFLKDAPEADPSSRLLREAGLESDFNLNQRRLTCREGRPYTIAVRKVMEGQQSILLRKRDGQVEGRSLETPQFTLQLHSRGGQRGEQWIQLIPEIQFGPVRQNFVANESMAFRVEHRRDRWLLDELLVKIPLAQGQALIIVPTPEPIGIGKQMLVGTKADQSEERIAIMVQVNRPPVHPIDG